MLDKTNGRNAAKFTDVVWDDKKRTEVEGRFAAYVIEDGKKTLHYEKKNVIVDGARNVMAHFIGDCPSSMGCIDTFQLGGDNSLDADTLLGGPSLPIPSPTDTEIMYDANMFTRRRGDEDSFGNSLFVVTYPLYEGKETQTNFELRILKPEANSGTHPSAAYVCAGLVVDTGWVYDPGTFGGSGWGDIGGGSQILFATQTFPVMAKTESREFLFSWTIRF